MDSPAPTDELNEDVSIEDLADLLEEDDLQDDPPEEQEEEPPEEDSEQDLDPDADDEGGDDDDSEDEEEEEDEDSDEPPAVAELKTRLKQQTARAKSAEEREAELKAKLEEAQLKAKAPREKSSTGYTSEEQIDTRETELRGIIADLEDLVAGEPNLVADEVSGDRVPNVIKLGEKEYTVQHIRTRLRGLREERENLPKAREEIKVRAADSAEARKLLPSAWRPGTPAYAERLAILKEVPEAQDLGDRAVVHMLLGRMALKKAAKPAKKSGKSSKTRGLKSGARVPASNTQNNKSGAKALMESMDVPDAEMADLAAALD